MPVLSKDTPEGPLPVPCAVPPFPGPNPDGSTPVYVPSGVDAHLAATAWEGLDPRFAVIGSAESTQCLHHFDVVYAHEGRYTCHSTVFSTGPYYQVRFGLDPDLAEQVVTLFRGLSLGQRSWHMFLLNWSRPIGLGRLVVTGGFTEAGRQSWEPQYLTWLDLQMQTQPPVQDNVYKQLAESRTHEYQGYFNDELQLVYAKTRRRVLAGHAPEDLEPADEAFPADDPVKIRALVKRLVEAMVDIDHCIEQPARGQAPASSRSKYRDYNLPVPPGHHWGPEVRAIYAQDDAELERIAHEHLYLLRDAQYGRIQVDPCQVDWKFDEFPSFMARFQALEEGFRRSKAAIKSTMLTPMAVKLCLAPKTEILDKHKQKLNNLRRAQELARDRAVQQQQGDEDEPNENEPNGGMGLDGVTEVEGDQGLEYTEDDEDLFTEGVYNAEGAEDHENYEDLDLLFESADNPEENGAMPVDDLYEG